MTTPADQLIQLASQQFGQLNSSEEKLLRASVTGEIAECATSQDKARDPKNYEVWGQERTIRSSILQWLCSRKEARDFVSFAGVKVTHARFVGEVNLAQISVGFSISLFDCALPDGLNLRDFTVRFLNLTGSLCGHLTAERLTVNGSLFLRRGFTATGQVTLIGASVSGDLECSGGHFGSPANQQKGSGSHVATNVVLALDRVSVGGGAFLGPSFVANGVVLLADATIKGSLFCTDSLIAFGINMRDVQTRTINFAGTNCLYLVADRINAKGSVFLRRGFRSEGGVVLFNSSITGDLDCNGGFFGQQLLDPDSSKNVKEIFGELPSAAIALNGSSIGGYVHFGYGFEANGPVWCNGVNIGANLNCDGGSFLAPGDPLVGALSCQFTQIRGAAVFRKDIKDRPFQSAGFVNLFGTNIAGSISFAGAKFFGPAPNGLKMQSASVAGNFRWKNVLLSENTELHLSHSRVGQFEDDDSSWPRQGKLKLDGFSYGALESVPLDTNSRKAWLSSHLNYLRRQAKISLACSHFVSSPTFCVVPDMKTTPRTYSSTCTGLSVSTAD